MLYIPEYFHPYELVDERTYYDYGHDHCMSLFDDRILWTIDQIRKKLDKPVHVNNWFKGGKFQFRGYRPYWCTEGTRYSQHRYGRAIDFDVLKENPEDIRTWLLSEECKDIAKYITAIEKDVNWVHIDCRNDKFKLIGK